MSTSDARKRTEEMLPKAAAAVLDDAVHRLAEAKLYYRDAIERCVQAGLTNRKMGQIAGVTEGAIRMYRKRKGI